MGSRRSNATSELSERTDARRASRVLSVVVSSFLSALVPTQALALPANAEAKAHLANGTEHYKRSEFDDAVEEFRKGYEIEADPVFLYSWAQAERRRGNCAASVKLYQRFLATKPEQLAAEYARDGILQCAEKLAGEDPLPPGDAEEPDPARPENDEPAETGDGRGSQQPDEVERRRTRARQWPRDPLGASLVAVGAAGTLVGVGVLGASAARDNNAPPGETYGQFDARQQQVKTMRIAGAAVGGIGLLILAGGIARWIIVARREKQTRMPDVSAALDGHSLGLVLSGRF